MFYLSIQEGKSNDFFLLPHRIFHLTEKDSFSHRMRWWCFWDEGQNVRLFLVFLCFHSNNFLISGERWVVLTRYRRKVDITSILSQNILQFAKEKYQFINTLKWKINVRNRKNIKEKKTFALDKNRLKWGVACGRSLWIKLWKFSSLFILAAINCSHFWILLTIWKLGLMMISIESQRKHCIKNWKKIILHQKFDMCSTINVHDWMNKQTCQRFFEIIEIKKIRGQIFSIVENLESRFIILKFYKQQQWRVTQV